MSKIIDEKPIEDEIFFNTFLCLKFCGFWKPTTIKYRSLQLCYTLYTYWVFITIGLMIIGPLLHMLTLRVNTLAHIMENSCLMAIASVTIMSTLNVILRRKRIIDVIKNKVLVERWTNLRNAEEAKIIKVSKSNEQNMLKYYMSLIIVNGISNILNPIIGENPDNNMIWNSWLPCDKRIPTCFRICYSMQAISYLIGSISHVAAGTLILNFLERICSHVRILQHRFSLLPELARTGVLMTAEDELFYLNGCINDHQNIYTTTKEICRIFSLFICVHFIIIFFILCTNIYILSNLPVFTGAFIAISLLLCCMMAEFFIYCWWGYKLTQIGTDIGYTIFSMNWLELRKETRKQLRFIMLYASKSIPLFNNFIVELSPEMFLKMLKLSYSAFNLLQARS